MLTALFLIILTSCNCVPWDGIPDIQKSHPIIVQNQFHLDSHILFSALLCFPRDLIPDSSLCQQSVSLLIFSIIRNARALTGRPWRGFRIDFLI